VPPTNRSDPSDRLRAIYRIRCGADEVVARAQAIAVEQSVEMPLAAVDDDRIRREVVGRVETITPADAGVFEVVIRLSVETVGRDAGQLLNMLFGNSSLHDDVVLADVELPAALLTAFAGPRHGIGGLRQRVGAAARALTCTALKPQGLPPERLAQLAVRFAQGGIDYIKDDHGLADQDSAPFAARLAAITAALRAAGSAARYVPSLSGDLDAMRRQFAAAAAAGIDTVMVAPMIMGLSNFQRLVRDHPDVAFLAHPAMAGAARIAPPLLIGKLFRLIGADAVIFPNHGGRFGYSAVTCRSIADAARKKWDALRPSMPVPAGGMSTARIREMLDFYGTGVMLLIGGALLEAGEQLPAATAAFVAEVANYPG
jgi:ribulose-bisphosphate carboxylase large chain